jgi:hypothetical protein
MDSQNGIFLLFLFSIFFFYGQAGNKMVGEESREQTAADVNSTEM